MSANDSNSTEEGADSAGSTESRAATLSCTQVWAPRPVSPEHPPELRPKIPARESTRGWSGTVVVAPAQGWRWSPWGPLCGTSLWELPVSVRRQRRFSTEVTGSREVWSDR